MFKNIIFNTESGVAQITLNRPAAMNALNHALVDELLEALRICREDETARAVVISGSGNAFCAGGDVKWMHAAHKEKWPHDFDRLVDNLNQVILMIRDIEKPVIAAVNGFASGAGFSLALACDIRVISEKAKFNQAYVNLGLTPDGGSTYFLTLMLGQALVTDLVFTGRVLEAKEALALGLASELTTTESLDARAKQLAQNFAAGPTIAFKQAKKLINEAHKQTLAAQLEAERKSIVSASLSNDFAEGLQAFAEKRTPLFKGN